MRQEGFYNLLVVLVSGAVLIGMGRVRNMEVRVCPRASLREMEGEAERSRKMALRNSIVLETLADTRDF